MNDTVTEAFDADGNSIELPTAVDITALPTAAEALADLDEGTREWLTKRHAKDDTINVVDLVKQAHASDQFAGGAVAVPKDDATPEELGKFYQRLGRPEDAKGYEFKVPDSLPEGLPYDQKVAEWFRDQAFSNGLSQKQASAMHDAFVAYQAENGADAAKVLGTDVKAILDKSEERLTEAWGAKDGDTFKQNVELAGRALDGFDNEGVLRDDLNKAGFIGPDGEVLIPSLAMMFAKLGASLLTEGTTLYDGGGAPAGENPFEGEGNLTHQMQLINANPETARALAVAAGKNPVEYGL